MEAQKEEWRPVMGYEGYYEVSSEGRVKRLGRWVNDNGSQIYLEENILNGSYDKWGYRRVDLTIKQKSKTYKIHRLVAEAFIPNPENKPTVDHINRKKDDNRVENLRWATHMEQMHFDDQKVLEEKKTRSKVVLQYALDGTFIQEWTSAREAERNNGYDHRFISACCNGKRKAYKGYRWCFKIK